VKPFQQGRFDDLPPLPRVPHPYFDSPSHRVDLDSVPFGRMGAHVVVVGKGPPLLLVHGLMTTSYSWRYMLEPLGRHFTLYVPDLPGTGRTDRPLGATYSVQNLGTWIRELQQALGIHGCAVVGNSLGGAVCAAALVQEPSCMERLLIEHAPGFPEPRLHLLRAVLSLPGTEALLCWLVRRNPLRWAHKNVHYWDESMKSVEEAEEYGRSLDVQGGAEAFYRYLKHAMNPSLLGRLQRTLQEMVEHPPICLLYARQDPMVPPRMGPLWASSLPAAELVWMEEGSHFAHVDRPELFLADTLPFLGVG
jgi:pimeloyl-ACP methyl ester carboxylesterase